MTIADGVHDACPGEGMDFRLRWLLLRHTLPAQDFHISKVVFREVRLPGIVLLRLCTSD